MMKSYKAGLIGCGNIGALYDERTEGNEVLTHAGMYRRVEGFDLACASDIDYNRLKRFGEHWGISAIYSNPVEMLQNEELDILSIATPDDTHSELLLQALEYSSAKIIFSEKPIADDLNTSNDIYRKSLQKGTTIVVDNIRRWDANHQKIKAYINNGLLGAVKRVIGYYVRGIRHNGCQMINLVRLLFGPVERVQAFGGGSCESYLNDKSLDLHLSLRNGLQVELIALDQDRYDYSIFELDIFAQEGRLRILDGGQRFALFSREKDPKFPNFNKLVEKETPWENSTYGTAMIRVGEQLLENLAGESNLIENDIVEALCDMSVIDAGFQSFSNNNSVVRVVKIY